MFDSKLTAIFREEAAEHLDVLERLLLAIEAGQEDPVASIDECFRRAHTLKGAARAVGVQAIQESAHELEDLLNPHRGGAKAISEAVLRESLSRIDTLRRSVEDATRPEPAGAGSTGSEEVSPKMPIPTKPAAEVQPTGLRIDSSRLDRMIGLLGNIQISHKAAEKVPEDIRRMFDILSHTSENLGRIESGLRQNVPQPDRLMSSMQECRLAIQSATESMNMLRAAIGSRLAEETVLLDQLDEEIRRARLVPLSTLALFLERAGRDAADEKGKKVVFKMTGGQVTLDRVVIDAIQEPLLHLVRNAVAHGIESPETRRTAGKPPEGSLTIEAYRRGNQARIRVKDDGRGVDLDRLRTLVASRKRLSSEEATAVSEESLLDALFHGGLSTSKEADTLSGRGAGLEIVRTRLRTIQGDVRIFETGPAGTTFELALPVHLQIMRIMIVRASSGVYGIPTAAIQKTVRIKSSDLRSVESRPVLPTPSGPVRLVSIDAALGLPEKSNGSADGVCLILESGGQSTAIQAEEILDETEVLIRDLGFPLGQLANIAGAAIRPDGSVLPVLNPAELGESAEAARDVSPGAPDESAPQRPRVLVVDDSPTTRSVLRGLFSAAGFDVALASDGVEGHTMFLQQGADVVVTDIQMPRMDGFAFTRALKSSGGRRVPVILVTGRESEADRRAGLESGADAYVVKSTFEEGDLIETVRRFL